MGGRRQMAEVLRLVRFGATPLRCSVDLDRARAYMGQGHHALPDDLEHRLEVAARLCERESSPRGVAASFAIAREDGKGLRLEGSPLTFPGANISHHLRECPCACLVAVTLGMDNERLLLRARTEGILEGMLVDACSSSMAEEAARVASEHVTKLAHMAGFSATRRFSPGFGDLPLELQSDFLHATGADRLLGIYAGKSYLMTPMKSVTAIIGLYPDSVERH